MRIPATYGEVNYRFSGTSYPLGAQVTLGFHNAGADIPINLCSTFEGLWSTHIKPLHTTHTLLQEVLVKLGPNDTGPSASIFPGVVGTGDTEDTMPSCAVLVRKVTALGGRKHRGRSYWPILSENEYENGGAVNPSSLSGLQSAFDDFFDACNSSDVPLFLLHSDATAPDTIVSLAVQSTFATQRRRLRK